MAGWLGVESLNIQHIATQYLLLLVVPIFGISQAISVLSSHLIGAKQSEMLSSFGYSAIKLGFIFTSIALVVFTLFPKALISIFVNTQDTSNYELIKTTTSLLLLVCTGQFFDALRKNHVYFDDKHTAGFWTDMSNVRYVQLNGYEKEDDSIPLETSSGEPAIEGMMDSE